MFTKALSLPLLIPSLNINVHILFRAGGPSGQGKETVPLKEAPCADGALAASHILLSS